MPTGKEVVDQGRMTINALAKAVRDEAITALDPNTLKPIDWDQLKGIHKNALDLMKKPPSKKKVRLCVYDNDQYYDTNINELIKVEFIPWNQFFRRIIAQREDILIIPGRQSEDFLNGWGIKIMIPYVLEAVFKKEDIMKVSDKEDIYKKNEVETCISINKGNITSCNPGNKFESPLAHSNDEFMSDELSLALKCSRELYPEIPTHLLNWNDEKKRIETWLSDYEHRLGSRERNRITTIVNPAKNPKKK